VRPERGDEVEARAKQKPVERAAERCDGGEMDRLSMRKIREILRLKYSGRSQREIASSVADFSNLAHAKAIHFAAVAPLRGALDRLLLRPGFDLVPALRPRGPWRSGAPESAFKSSGIGVQVLRNQRSGAVGTAVQVAPESAFKCVRNTHC